jgi:hypothetical protein
MLVEAWDILYNDFVQEPQKVLFSPDVHKIAILHIIAASIFWHRKHFYFARDVGDKTKYIQLWLSMNANANIEKNKCWKNIRPIRQDAHFFN